MEASGGHIDEDREGEGAVVDEEADGRRIAGDTGT